MKQLFYFLILFSFTASAQLIADNSITNISEKVYRGTEVDLKPQLKEGIYTVSMFMSGNFKFPPAIKNKKITIFSSFVVEKDGSITDVKAFHIKLKDYIQSNIKKVRTKEEKMTEIDQIETMKGETARVLSLFKTKWTPALKDGQPVRCLYNFPVNFIVQ